MPYIIIDARSQFHEPVKGSKMHSLLWKTGCKISNWCGLLEYFSGNTIIRRTPLIPHRGTPCAILPRTSAKRRLFAIPVQELPEDKEHVLRQCEAFNLPRSTGVRRNQEASNLALPFAEVAGYAPRLGSNYRSVELNPAGRVKGLR